MATPIPCGMHVENIDYILGMIFLTNTKGTFSTYFITTDFYSCKSKVDQYFHISIDC